MLASTPLRYILIAPLRWPINKYTSYNDKSLARFVNNVLSIARRIGTKVDYGDSFYYISYD